MKASASVRKTEGWYINVETTVTMQVLEKYWGLVYVWTFFLHKRKFYGKYFFFGNNNTESIALSHQGYYIIQLI